MSFPTVNGLDSTAVPQLEYSEGTPKPTYRSFKKKYRKMRHAFEEKMRASNSLFADEQKAVKLARRLQEQNDQLLDLLLEVNESTQIPPHLRYDLRSPTPSESAVPPLEPDNPPSFPIDVKSARAALEEARLELTTGQISPNAFAQLETALILPLNKPKTFTELYGTSHSALEIVKASEEEVMPSDIGETTPAGYLSPTHEEEYLNAMDAQLEASLLGIQPPPSSHPIRSNERHERDRENQLRNPVSVYNWLRKHQPQVFLQDNESASISEHQKPPGNSKQLTSSSHTKTSSKRTSVAPKQEQEIVDEEGFVIGGGAGEMEVIGRSKRKRDDEPYRPKGGSSRPAKKKRTTGVQTERRRESGEDVN